MKDTFPAAAISLLIGLFLSTNSWAADTDLDGIDDLVDNCPQHYNPRQVNLSGSGKGDACAAHRTEDRHTEWVVRYSADEYQEAARDCLGVREALGQRFVAVYAPESGCELHRVGDNGVPELVQDLRPGAGNGLVFGRLFGREVGDWFVFIGENEAHGQEWWRTDGQVIELLADINPGPESGLDLGPYWSLDEGLVFFANAGNTGQELWFTDGNTAEPLPEMVDGPGQLDHLVLLEWRGQLYVLGTDSTDPERQVLYATDGKKLRLVGPWPYDTSTPSTRGQALKNGLLFPGKTEQHGEEPWVFDGGLPRLLDDLRSGAESSDCCDRRFSLGDKMVFNAVETVAPGIHETGFYLSDGKALIPLPHDGPDIADIDLAKNQTAFKVAVTNRRGTAAFNVSSPAILLDDPAELANEGPLPNLVMRANEQSTRLYELDNATDAFSQRISYGILGEHTLVLVDNELFRLYPDRSDRSEMKVATDLDNSDLFIRYSHPMGDRLVLEEKSGAVSRLHHWNFYQSGRLLSEEGHALSGFRFVGEFSGHVYWYTMDDSGQGGLVRAPLALGLPSPYDAPITGTWFDPATAGQGLVIHQVDEVTNLFSFYGFDNEGAPLWLIGVGDDDIGLFLEGSVSMITARGGRFGDFDPVDVTETHWGTLDIRFTECGKAVVTLDGLTGRQALALQQIAGVNGLKCGTHRPPATSVAGLTGTWFEPATSGQGLVMHPINNRSMIVSFYGFDNDGDPLWLIGIVETPLGFGQDIVIDMKTATGGHFGAFDPAEIEEKPWGTLTLNFSSCQQGGARLDGADGQQELSLVKLLGLQGTETNCP